MGIRKNVELSISEAGVYQGAVAAHAAAVIGPPSDAPEFAGLEEEGRVRTYVQTRQSSEP
jgi:hypothetical protein